MAYIRPRTKRNQGKQMLPILVMLLFLVFLIWGESKRMPVNGNAADSVSGNAGKMNQNMVSFVVPLVGFLEGGEVYGDLKEAFFSLFFCGFPLYEYTLDSCGNGENLPMAYTYEMVILQEGSDEDYEQMMMYELAQENRPAEESILTEQAEVENHGIGTIAPANTSGADSFVPAPERTITYDREDLADYDFLIRNFYIVDAGTTVTEEQLDVEAFLSMDMTLEEETEGPQILIYHTHSQEAFSDSVPGDVSTTIVGMGELLAEILTRDYGYRVLHHTGEYDLEQLSYAYTNAEDAIARILEENPSIEVVIDLHRDSMPEETRLVTELNGRPTARFMFFNGLSYVNDLGSIDYLYNPYLEENMAFSFQMQLAACEYYPGLTRRIYLKGYRYNMHLAEKYLLIELGAQNNTVEEARNACYPIAHLLDVVLSGEGEE